jgi:hypothetical protein
MNGKGTGAIFGLTPILSGLMAKNSTCPFSVHLINQ